MHMNYFLLISQTVTQMHALLNADSVAATSSVSILIRPEVKGRLWGRTFVLLVDESTGNKVSSDR
jgi:hypothetical protein